MTGNSVGEGAVNCEQQRTFSQDVIASQIIAISGKLLFLKNRCCFKGRTQKHPFVKSFKLYKVPISLSVSFTFVAQFACSIFTNGKKTKPSLVDFREESFSFSQEYFTGMLCHMRCLYFLMKVVWMWMTTLGIKTSMSQQF